MDARGRLGDKPYSWLAVRDSSVVIISRDGRPVTTLRDDAARRFMARVEGTDAIGAQHLMARATGNFRHGNER